MQAAPSILYKRRELLSYPTGNFREDKETGQNHSGSDAVLILSELGYALLACLWMTCTKPISPRFEKPDPAWCGVVTELTRYSVGRRC